MAAFGDELTARGFEQVESRRWLGPIVIPGPAGSELAKPHTVALLEDFPFSPPAVSADPPPTDAHWHMEHDGRLCLWPRGEEIGRPWEDVDVLFAKVADWYRQSELGWPDEPGDLDLERYFKDRSFDTLVAYEDLDALIDRRLKVTNPSPKVYRVEPEAPIQLITPKQLKRERLAAQKGRIWGAGVDLGVLEQPVNSWRSLTLCIDKHVRGTLWHLARTRDRGIIVARYGRPATGGIITGALAVMVNRTGAGPATPPLTALEVEDRSLARQLRVGPDASLLAEKAVAIVGCGAVGSFLAEEIGRSGVRLLTLVDDERLRFGNCVRHLADESFVNEFKTDAVKSILVTRHRLKESSVSSIRQQLSPELAFRILSDHDLVIDATADSRAHDILGHLAEVVDQQWMKVVLHREGAIVRVDRLGPRTAVEARRPPPVEALPGAQDKRESGCGDPVSPTPPNAVRSAAALAFRVALDTLRPRLRRQYPDSVVEVLAPSQASDSDPYRRIAIVTG